MACPPWPRGRRLVHLDLKGAPPRMEYLLKLIQVFSELGVEGLLVEYEDMFPYGGELQLLQATAQPAYSREDVLLLQDGARSAGMEVIPLVQTFGHMEFVLKHQSMLHLREVPHCLGTLNPHKEEAVKVVLEMLRQVVELHPGVRTLHIGADEVYLLGEGEESRSWLASPGRTVEQLFLDHVTKVARAVKEAWPHVTVIMWDDMMREMSGETLKACGLVGLVQPMLWDYNPNLDVEQTGTNVFLRLFPFTKSDLQCVLSLRHMDPNGGLARRSGLYVIDFGSWGHQSRIASIAGTDDITRDWNFTPVVEQSRADHDTEPEFCF